MDYRVDPINNEGYWRLLEKIFDHPDWYHEYHDMLHIILKEASNEHIEKYLKVKRAVVRNYWTTDAHEPTYEKYLLVVECYENL